MIFVAIAMMSAFVALAAGVICVMAVPGPRRKLIVSMAVSLGVFAVGACVAWVVDPPHPNGTEAVSCR